MSFRVSAVGEIEIKSNAESRNMRLSEFILYCINKELEDSKNKNKEEKERQAKDERLHDFDRLIETIVEVNRTANKSIESVQALREDICAAMSAVFPDKRIFFNMIFSNRH